MQDSNRLDAILSEVEQLPLLHSPRRLDDLRDEGIAALEGEIVIEGRSATLRLVLDPHFPLRLPQFFLQPWDALGFIPHVLPSGFICFADPEGLVLDRSRPVAVVQDAIQRVHRVLSDGVVGRNRSDFVDEFDVYWQQLSGGVTAMSMLEPLSEVDRVVVASINKGGLHYVAGSRDDISAFCNGTWPKDVIIQKAIYLPLEPGTVVVPPRHDRPFWSAEEARCVLLPGLSQASQARIRRLVNRHKQQSREFIIVRLPRPSGGAALFGIQYDGTGNRHPLIDGGTATRLVPLHLHRLEHGYLVQRGGGSTNLASKHVIIVGCGAIGGHLAFELARSGVLNLTLIDPDALKAENSFRHVLGRRYWGERKVRGLKKEIESQLPYTQVTAIAKSIEEALADGSVKLTEYDLAVLATGNPTVELEINERLHALKAGPPAVFTWLEPLGIGGHALLTGNARNFGCFECLYTAPDDNVDSLVNRAAFAGAGQSFGRALSGCGSLHTPYGAMHAVRTAGLAAQLVIDALNGKEQGNPLLSWKGNSEEFRKAGFHLSARYQATEDQIFRQRYSYHSARCRICGTRE